MSWKVPQFLVFCGPMAVVNIIHVGTCELIAGPFGSDGQGHDDTI